MKIQKKYQGAIPLNRIANEHNESEINTYSTNYVNSQLETLQNDVDELQTEVQTINTKLPKVVACNYSDWQEQQVIEGTGAGATITGFETSLTTTGGNILVSMTVPITKTGGTCWLNIYVDGVKAMQYGVSGSGGILSYTNVFGVAPGFHTVSAAIHNNNVQTVTIYNYTSRAFTVAEI